MEKKGDDIELAINIIYKSVNFKQKKKHKNKYIIINNRNYHS